MKETAGTVTKEFTYLGGDAYHAPVVAVTQSGATTYYYLLRDYLGNITHVYNSSNSTTQEYSFDAWGRRRNPTDWSYDLTSQPELFAGRGFTSHEHLPWFNLVNMNGRLYDPAVGRFISPDPNVQMPNMTQSMNRYTYCMNNPLKYKDPSGQFFIIDDFVIGFVKGLFKGDNPFKSGYQQAENCVKIYAGLFTGNPLQILSRFTWELPQTILGLGASQTLNTIGDVKSVSYYDGATVLKGGSDGLLYGLGGPAMTLGSFIMGNNQIEANPNNFLFQHEYGHYLQSQSSGLFYLSKYGIPSLLSKKPYNKNPVEQDANVRAFSYFNKHVDGFNSVDKWGNQQSSWDYSYNPINDYNWSLPYNDPANQTALENGRLRLSWYDYLLGPNIVASGLLNTLIINHQY